MTRTESESTQVYVNSIMIFFLVKISLPCNCMKGSIWQPIIRRSCFHLTVLNYIIKKSDAWIAVHRCSSSTTRSYISICPCYDRCNCAAGASDFPAYISIWQRLLLDPSSMPSSLLLFRFSSRLILIHVVSAWVLPFMSFSVFFDCFPATGFPLQPHPLQDKRYFLLVLIIPGLKISTSSCFEISSSFVTPLATWEWGIWIIWFTIGLGCGTKGCYSKPCDTVVKFMAESSWLSYWMHARMP